MSSPADAATGNSRHTKIAHLTAARRKKRPQLELLKLTVGIAEQV
jgi:hypothetical protein